jgi:hypothetical protein
LALPKRFLLALASLMLSAAVISSFFFSGPCAFYIKRDENLLEPITKANKLPKEKMRRRQSIEARLEASLADNENPRALSVESVRSFFHC